MTLDRAALLAGIPGEFRADELADAGPLLCNLLGSLPAETWDGPAPGNPDYTLRFAVEAIWYDTYLHGEDVRDALQLPSARGDGLRCAVHHVVGYLEHRHCGPATLALSGSIESRLAAEAPRSPAILCSSFSLPPVVQVRTQSGSIAG